MFGSATRARWSGRQPPTQPRLPRADADGDGAEAAGLKAKEDFLAEVDNRADSQAGHRAAHRVARIQALRVRASRIPTAASLRAPRDGASSAKANSADAAAMGEAKPHSKESRH